MKISFVVHLLLSKMGEYYGRMKSGNRLSAFQRLQITGNVGKRKKPRYRDFIQILTKVRKHLSRFSFQRERDFCLYHNYTKSVNTPVKKNGDNFL